MKIEEHHKANFNTLLRAANDGNLALLDVLDTQTGKPARALCAVEHDGKSYTFVPLATMIEDDPYERYAPPSSDGYSVEA